MSPVPGRLNAPTGAARTGVGSEKVRTESLRSTCALRGMSIFATDRMYKNRVNVESKRSRCRSCNLPVGVPFSPESVLGVFVVLSLSPPQEQLFVFYGDVAVPSSRPKADPTQSSAMEG